MHAMLEVAVVGLDRSQVMNNKMIPAHITTGWSVRVSEGTQKRTILRRISTCNEPIGRQRSGYRTSEQAYRRGARRVEMSFRVRDCLNFCRNIFKYSPSAIYQSMIRSAARRMGREMV